MILALGSVSSDRISSGFLRIIVDEQRPGGVAMRTCAGKILLAQREGFLSGQGGKTSRVALRLGSRQLARDGRKGGEFGGAFNLAVAGESASIRVEPERGMPMMKIGSAAAAP